MYEVLTGGTAVGYRAPEYEDPPWFVYPGWTPEQTGWQGDGERVDVE